MSLSLFRSPLVLRDLDQLFDDMDQTRQLARRSFAPKMSCDVTDSAERFEIHAELPGVTKDQIDISVDRGVLTIQAVKEDKRSSDAESVSFTERSYGKVSRAFKLPPSVALESSKCSFENGMLTVSFDKNPDQVISRKLEIL
jgi:HSP20 family protein